MAWNEPGGDGKDPWGRHQNEQGPPDLEELARKLREKVGGWFGGSGRGGGANDGQGLPLAALALLLAASLFLWSLLGFYIVQPAEKGVELYFGRHIRTTQAGWRWHAPYPIAQAIKVNVEELRAIRHEAIMLTQDENLVDVEIVIQYKVADPEAYLFNVRNSDDTLQQAAESALREIVGTSKMDDVLTSGREVVATNTKILLQDILDRYKAGLSVRNANLQNAQPPEAVQAAFADVIKAREDEEGKKNTAEAYANEVFQRARGMADQIRHQAEAYKVQVIAKAEGETNRFLSVLDEYSKAPDITRQRLYLETMESVLGQTQKVILDTQTSQPLLYLPLGALHANEPQWNSQISSSAGQTSRQSDPVLSSRPSGQDSTARPPREEAPLRSNSRSAK